MVRIYLATAKVGSYTVIFFFLSGVYIQTEPRLSHPLSEDRGIVSPKSDSERLYYNFCFFSLPRLYAKTEPRLSNPHPEDRSHVTL